MMSSNSSLTAEQLKRIEEKRKQALQRKAAAEAARKQASSLQQQGGPQAVRQPAAVAHPSTSNGMPSSNFYKSNNDTVPKSYKTPLDLAFSRTGPSGSTTVSYSNGEPDPKKLKTSMAGSSSAPSVPIKVVTGTCKMISKERFAVFAGYHQQMIELFKTIPSKIYDIQTRNWSFLLKDHDQLMKELKKIGPSISISEVPKFIRKIFLKKSTLVKEDVDLSRIDKKLLDALMPFQEEGVKYCIAHGGRAMIADDMGLGKTIQALAVAHYYIDDWPLLIVCPSSVRFTWAEAFHSWLPSVPRHQVAVMITGKDFVADAKVVILSYDLLSKQGAELMRMKFNMIILDESHSLKNFKTNRSKATLPFAKKANRIILLSGTPALSRPIELHFQLNLINPSITLGYQEYGIRYCSGQMKPWGWDFSGSSNMDELNLLLQECYMIRRLKVDVLTQLPAKFRQLVELPAGMVNMKMAQLKEAEASLHRASNTEKQGALLAYFHATSTAKLKAICDYVMDMVKDDKKFLCFAHHRPVIDSICAKLDAGNYRYIRIDGSTDSKLRQELCTKFQEDDRYRVAVLSITAANTGITLTAAHLVLFVELFWNPGVLLQAEDRAHRIGQQDSVVVQYLLAKGTADDHLWRLLQKKLSVLRRAGLNEDDLTNAALTRVQDRTQPAIDNIFQPDKETEMEDELLATMDLDALIMNNTPPD